MEDHRRPAPKPPLCKEPPSRRGERELPRGERTTGVDLPQKVDAAPPVLHPFSVAREGPSIATESPKTAPGPEEANATLSFLLIDDDRELCAMMKQFFAEFGYRLHAEHDGPRGVIAAKSGTYSLVILDVMLPGFDGFSVLRHIRRRGNLPVIMLTARARHHDRIQGLNSGADDYLLKPFDPDELLARVRAVLRRADTRPADRTLRLDGLHIDFATRAVKTAEETIDLTEMEFDLLEVLIRSGRRIVSRDELALHLFDRPAAPHDRILDVHVSNLRKKLGSGRDLIRTVRGVGYVLTRHL